MLCFAPKSSLEESPALCSSYLSFRVEVRLKEHCRCPPKLNSGMVLPRATKIQLSTPPKPPSHQHSALTNSMRCQGRQQHLLSYTVMPHFGDAPQSLWVLHLRSRVATKARPGLALQHSCTRCSYKEKHLPCCHPSSPPVMPCALAHRRVAVHGSTVHVEYTLNKP